MVMGEVILTKEQIEKLLARLRRLHRGASSASDRLETALRIRRLGRCFGPESVRRRSQQEERLDARITQGP